MKKKFKIPHTFAILFYFLVLIMVMTWVVPAGSFERVMDEANDVETVVPGTFAFTGEQSPVNPLELFFCIQKGFVESASVIFLVIFAYFCVYTVTKTQSLHAAIGALLKKVGNNEHLLIPIFTVIFALAGSTYGEWDTIYGLIPIFVGVCIAIGYDAMVGLAVTGMAVGVGFASATTNPFTIGIAQSIAGIPLFSGLALRVVVFIVFVGTATWWTMRYAKKIRKNPDASYVKGIDMGSLKIDRSELDKAEFTGKRKFTMLFLFLTIAVIVFGSLKLGWYIDEMSGVFLCSGLLVSLFWRMKPNEIVENFMGAAREILMGAMIVGLSRSILVVLEEGNIIDTIIYALYVPLQHLPSWVSAEGMLLLQNIMNLFIPSGSGQAAAVMPLMTPLSDLTGVSRQVAVLAYQFGDGYSNLFWPTGGIIVMGTIARVPLNKWYKFFAPLFGMMLVLEVIFIFAAVMLGYQ